MLADYLHQWLTVYVDDIIMWARTQHDALRCYELLFARAVKVGIQFKHLLCQGTPSPRTHHPPNMVENQIQRVLEQ